MSLGQFPRSNLGSEHIAKLIHDQRASPPMWPFSTKSLRFCTKGLLTHKQVGKGTTVHQD